MVCVYMVSILCDSSYCAFVFTTDGEYVTTFGQNGQKEGDFIYRHYACVDNNRFVYVTDYLIVKYSVFNRDI